MSATNENTEKLKRKYRGRTSESEMELILLHHSRGISNTYISKILQIPRSTVVTNIKRMKEGKPFLPQGGDRRSLLNDENKKTLHGWVEKDPTITLKELQQKTLELLGVKCSLSTIKRSLKTFDYTIKVISTKPQQIDSSSIIDDRFVSADLFKKMSANLDIKQFIFMDLMQYSIELVINKRDEANTESTYSSKSDIKIRHIFILAGMNKCGIISYKIYEDPIDMEIFQNFLMELKRELLQTDICDPIFIFNDAISQKYHGITKMVEDEKMKVFYVPQHSWYILHPIEQCFIKWRKYVQRDRVQNEGQLNQSMENGFVIITEQDCKEYYNEMLKYLDKTLNKEIID
ncbi:hypothetical protein A3Q56_02390 [Intoshia linei]|uniref:Tc1-like transposase DDE domain-containing protein n=1 Tax=Intoshia linei TaxID=1819745 RepID=A0A177B6E9_9BILA|nr:hypothetical protein A3Q56_02390 [Intoshia linei]